MTDPKHLIPHITDASKSWAVRVTVTESIPILVCNNGSKLKRYVLAYKEGNEVVAAIYGDDVDVLGPMIKLFGVYDISNADVKSIDKKYRILQNPFQWNIRRQTLIRAVPEANPMLTYILDSLTPFSKITDANNLGINTADIMAIIIDVGEVKSVNRGCSNVQHFTIIDLEKIPLRLSLWDEMIENKGRELIDAATRHSVIVAKRLAIKTYNSISLASKNSTSFAIDPPLQAARNIKSWFQTIPDSELEELKAKKTSTFTKDLITTGKMRTYTVSEVVKNVPAGDYWVTGYLHLVDDDQKLYYVACNNCLTKIKADVGLQYTCFLCKKNVTATLSLLVNLSMADQTDKVEVVAVKEAAEKILQTTTEDMTRLYNSGQKLDLDPIKAKLYGKAFLMLLRRTTGAHSENQHRLMLISYHEQSTIALQSLPSASTNTSVENYPKNTSSNYDTKGELPLSPLKRQMSEVAISEGKTSKKQLTMTKGNKEEDIQYASEHVKED